MQQKYVQIWCLSLYGAAFHTSYGLYYGGYNMIYLILTWVKWLYDTIDSICFIDKVLFDIDLKFILVTNTFVNIQ